MNTHLIFTCVFCLVTPGDAYRVAKSQTSLEYVTDTTARLEEHENLTLEQDQEHFAQEQQQEAKKEKLEQDRLEMLQEAINKKKRHDEEGNFSDNDEQEKKEGENASAVAVGDTAQTNGTVMLEEEEARHDEEGNFSENDEQEKKEGENASAVAVGDTAQTNGTVMLEEEEAHACPPALYFDYGLYTCVPKKVNLQRGFESFRCVSNHVTCQYCVDYGNLPDGYQCSSHGECERGDCSSTRWPANSRNCNGVCSRRRWR